MTESPSSDLAQRVARLEGEARCWRVAFVLLLAGLAGLTPLVATSQTAPSEITAKRFVLVDDAGRRRADLQHLGVEPHGATSLAFYDDLGHRRATFGVSQRVAGAYFYDDTDPLKFRVLLFGGDRPRVILTGKDGFPRVSLLVADDVPNVELRRPDGRIWKAP